FTINCCREAVSNRCLWDALLGALAVDLLHAVRHEDTNGRLVGEELANVTAVPVTRLPFPGAPRIDLGFVEMRGDAVRSKAIVRQLKHPPQPLRPFVNQSVAAGALVPTYPRRELERVRLCELLLTSELPPPRCVRLGYTHTLSGALLVGP